jgi:hypothetical protein
LASLIKEFIEDAFQECSVEVFRAGDGGAIHAGSDWLEAVKSALRDADAMVSLVGPASVKQPWINIELGVALANDLDVIPACHSGQRCGGLPRPLQDFHGVDLEGKASCAALVAGLENSLKLTAKRSGLKSFQARLTRAINDLSRQVSPGRSFFGALAAEKAHAEKLPTEFAIHLQSDEILDMLSGPKSHQYGIQDVVTTRLGGKRRTLSLADLFNQHANGRMYKAREWVNRFDAEAARELAGAVRGATGTSPEVTTDVHVSSEIPNDHAGMAIYMGLGFTDLTQLHMEEICHGWADLQVEGKFGDCLWLVESLPKFARTRLPGKRRLVPRDARIGWSRIVPEDWSPKLLSTPPQKRKAMSDYGIILRHTHDQGKHSRVVFICAGFTEVGTFQAGRHLGQQWKKLSDRAAQNDNDRFGCGDFLAVISGMTKQRGTWQDVEFFITPGTLLRWWDSARPARDAAYRRSMPEWIRRWKDREKRAQRGVLS